MNKIILTIALILSAHLTFAQLPKLAVVSFDVNDQSLKRQELLEVLRLEMSKEVAYSTIDKYEIAESLKKEEIDPSTCFSLSCLKTAGKLLGADYVLTGSANKLGDRIFISLRMIDMKTNEQVETSQEFSFIPEKASTMTRSVVNKRQRTDQLHFHEAPHTTFRSTRHEHTHRYAVETPVYHTYLRSQPRVTVKRVVNLDVYAPVLFQRINKVSRVTRPIYIFAP